MKFKQEQIRAYFPKEPYSIQKSIAGTIYQALEDKLKLVVVESPTGTGKTYSLLCPILAWLTNNRANIAHNQPAARDQLPIWLKKVSNQKGQKLLKQKEKALEEMTTFSSVKESRKSKIALRGKQETVKVSKQSDQQVQIDSEQENKQVQGGKKRIVDREQVLIENQLKIQEKNALPKLIFVSRTHSQLTQVIDSLKDILKDRSDINYIELASKQQLCINKSINTHKNNINEQCQHLLDHGQCPYFHHFSIKEFYNQNIEEITQLGSDHDLCPYYSSRAIAEYADVLCVPYSSILSRDVRNKLGINIHNSIIVFDEGHNLIDYEKQMRSPEVKIEEFQRLAQQVDQYLLKYKQRLKIKNEKLLVHLLQILRSMVEATQYFKAINGKATHKYVRLSYIDFLVRLSLKEIGIHKIIKYFQLNNIDKKIAYFNNQSSKKPFEGPNAISTGAVNRILTFLLEFVNFKQHQQLILLKWGESAKGTLKIMCLETEQLQNIIEKSRMTIVAGGTMEPLDELIRLSWKWKQKMIIEKYPHIIKENQCKIYVIKKIDSQEIIFNHHTLSQSQHLSHFKQICTKILSKVIQRTQKGGGIVVFIQNYQLLGMFQNIFKGEPYEQQILYDSRERNEKDAEDLFTKYKKAVENDKERHHILVSVMGGKLSEGINFSDRLARSLIVFGLPYSNIFAPEIVQTMAYLDQKKNPSFTGRIYYQNLCIKTLNQTIGRGVRHINDYVDIYLVDSRFEAMSQKLSNWMRPRIKILKDLSEL